MQLRSTPPETIDISITATRAEIAALCDAPAPTGRRTKAQEKVLREFHALLGGDHAGDIPDAAAAR